MSREYKFASVKTNEFPVQICQLEDGQFNGIAILTNYGNIYRYSNRFHEVEALIHNSFFKEADESMNFQESGTKT